MKQIIFDQRTRKGRIWNLKETLARFPFGDPGSPWNQQAEETNDAWIDQFVYEGFCAHKIDFLQNLQGRFAIVFHDTINHRVFVLRDWIGEMPFHYLATESGIFFANTINDLMKSTGEDFLYDNLRSFPQSHYQIIELKDIEENNVAGTFRPDKRVLYFDFESKVMEKVNPSLKMSGFDFTRLSSLIKTSVSRRANRHSNDPNYLLLSGGLDSLSVAVAMKSAGIPFETYTLSVDNKLGEAEMASLFAKKLGVKHYIINLTTSEIIKAFRESIITGEIYHLYNVYCTVGMTLMGKKLSEQGIANAFCGEAMNEAVGDYKDWKIFDPVQHKEVIVQKINTERLQNINERILYVWGHSVDKGKYNRQLGTGLAKHGGARMIKPFMAHGIDLECPYYEPDFLSSIVALTPLQLREFGYKPGLLWQIFQRDFSACGFDEQLIRKCKKIRLQDTTENGDSGISSVLLTTGNDQEKTLTIFNNYFKAGYNIKEKAKNLLCIV